MKVIRFKKAESYEPQENWKRVNLCNEKNISLEYFIKPPKHTSPMHQHPQEQVLVVIKGVMKAHSEGSPSIILKEGDTAYFSANEPHSVENELDEPSIGLAPMIVDKLFMTIVEINKMGITILLVEQNAAMALEIADKGYVLETGRCILEGSAQELANNESVKRAYLGG